MAIKVAHYIASIIRGQRPCKIPQCESNTRELGKVKDDLFFLFFLFFLWANWESVAPWRTQNKHCVNVSSLLLKF